MAAACRVAVARVVHALQASLGQDGTLTIFAPRSHGRQAGVRHHPDWPRQPSVELRDWRRL